MGNGFRAGGLESCVVPNPAQPPSDGPSRPRAGVVPFKQERTFLGRVVIPGHVSADAVACTVAAPPPPLPKAGPCLG
jgi:hypothetical protein